MSEHSTLGEVEIRTERCSIVSWSLVGVEQGLVDGWKRAAFPVEWLLLVLNVPGLQIRPLVVELARVQHSNIQPVNLMTSGYSMLSQC